MIFHGSDIFFCLEYITGMNQGVYIKKEGIFEDPQVLLRIAYRNLKFLVYELTFRYRNNTSYDVGDVRPQEAARVHFEGVRYIAGLVVTASIARPATGADI